MPFPLIRPLRLTTSSLVLLLCALVAHAQNAPPPAATPATRPAGSDPADGTTPPPGAAAASAPTGADAALLSRDARRFYGLPRDKLVQIRTLLRNANTQASIGSGFFVSADGLIVTNFHVASQLALEPERYRGVYGTMEGPAVDDAGRVLGVNVAKRLDCEQVSFLIPAEFSQALVQRAANAQPITQAAHAEMTRQLMEHQQLLTDRFLKAPFREQRHGNCRVPVPDDALARCWGSGRDPAFPGLNLERTQCRADSDVVAGEFNTGAVRLSYEAYNAPTLGAARFARMFSQSFANEQLQRRGNRHQTATECTERFVDPGSLPLRAVVCLSAYRKLPGLYNMTVLAASINQPTQGVLGRLDVQGIAFDNGMKLASHYLKAFRWEAAP